MRLKLASWFVDLRDKYLWRFILFSFLLILFSYGNLIHSFYQQDEWMTIGFAKAAGLGSFLKSYSLAQILSGQGRILALPLTYIFFNILAFKIYPIAIFAIIVHLLNSILVYLIIKKLSKNLFISFLSGLLFSTIFISHQSLSWFAATTTTLPAAFFTFLSVYLYLVFLEKLEDEFLYLSEIFLIVSLNFKESGLFLFVLIPLLYIIFRNKKVLLKNFIKKYWLFLFYGMFIVFSRIGLVLKPAGTGVVVTDSPYALDKLISHVLIYPLSSLSQIFIYPSVLYRLADVIQNTNYHFINTTAISGLTAQSLTSEAISIYFSSVIIVLAILIFSFYKDLRKVIVFAISYCFLATIPYVIFDKSTAYLETRFYYLIVPGAVLLFAVFAEVFKRILVKFKFNFKTSFLIVGLLSSFYLLKQSFYIRKDLSRDAKTASIRLNFLKQLSNLYPTIGEKTIFYIDGDTDYSGIKIPFQQGPGYTLMVWYYGKGKYPNDFLVESFLWGMAEQGYKESNGFGFGYYWDYARLKGEIKKKVFKPENVIALYYKGKEGTLIDKTEMIRRELKNQLK